MKRFLLLIACASRMTSFAAEAILTGDSTTRRASPSVNMGSLPQLTVDPDSRAYLQFSLSGLPAGTTKANIGNAVLKLYVNRVITPGPVMVGNVNGPWSESAIMDSNAPAISSLGSVQVDVANTFVSVDVTQIVRNWFSAPESNFGIGLASVHNSAVYFDSKESTTTSQPARLEINLIAQGPQGIPGQTGAQGAAGAPGPAGPQGPAGAVSDSVMAWYPYVVEGHKLSWVSIYCPPLFVAVSGSCGHRDDNSASQDIVLNAVGSPISNSGVYECRLTNNSSDSRTVNFGTLCMQIPTRTFTGGANRVVASVSSQTDPVSRRPTGVPADAKHERRVDPQTGVIFESYSFPASQRGK